LLKKNYTTQNGRSWKIKLQEFVVIDKDLTHACLGNNIVAVPGQLLSTASQIKEMCGKSMSVIDFSHCTNKAILCPNK
jgi:hypothetical protein